MGRPRLFPWLVVLFEDDGVYRPDLVVVGTMHVPAPVVVQDVAAVVQLADGELAYFAAVDAERLTRLLIVFYLVFVLAARRRACENAFAPHGGFLLTVSRSASRPPECSGAPVRFRPPQ